MTIQLEVFSKDDPTIRLDVIPLREDPKILEEIDGDGGGSFDIHNDDDRLLDPEVLQDRNIVKFKVDGVVRSGFIIQKNNPTIVASGELSATQTTISGKGLIDWFSDASVKPYGGVRPTSFDNRAFNFASEMGTWYEPSDWTSPAVISKWGDDVANPWRYAPANWPDAPEAYWIWGTALPAPPLGLNFFRHEFTTTSSGKYSFFCAADDVYEVYLDGQLAANATPGVENWSQTQRIDFEFEAGDHVVGVKVNNTEGRGGFIGALFRAGDPSVEEPASLLSVTNSSTWTVCAYPDEQPGWTPGEVLLTLLEEAEDRGVWFPKFLTPTFDEDVDSNGVPWTRAIDWSFRVGEEYLSVLQKFAELACDVWIDADTLELHAAATRGTDRSLLESSEAPVIFIKGYNLVQAKQTNESDIKNSLLINSNSGMLERNAPDSIVKYGVIEDTLDVAADAELSTVIADKVLAESSVTSEGATYKVIVREGAVPFVDFQVGDWVLAPGSDGPKTKRRVSSISVLENKKTGQAEYDIEFDTIFRSRQANLERWMTNTLSGSMGGTVVSSGAVTNGTPSPGPSSGGELRKIPSTPEFTNIVSEAMGYWDSGGNPKASMTFYWDAVTTYTDGSTAAIPRYEVWMYKFGQSPTTSSVLGTATGNTTIITNLDSGTQYVFTLYAVSNQGTYSAVSSEVIKTAAFPSEKLLAPSQPTLTSSMSTITVRWDGLLGGAQPPPQFSNVQVQYSRNEDGPWLILGTTIGRGGGSSVLTSLAVGDTYYVKLLAVDTLGNYSPESAADDIEVVGVEFSELDEAIVDLINNAVESVDGKNSIFVAPASDPPTAYTQGDLWYVRGVGPDANKITDVRIWNGTIWNPYQIVADSVLVPSSVGNILLADGAVSTPKLQANAVTANEINFGSAEGEAMFIGGRPVQGEAQQRVPAPVTDLNYWTYVKSEEIVLNPDVEWSSGVIPTAAGFTIPNTGVEADVTPIIPVPQSRRVYVSYNTTTTNMTSVVWLDENKDILQTDKVRTTGEQFVAPDDSHYYYVILRDPEDDVTISYTYEDIETNLSLNPSIEVSAATYSFSYGTIVRSDDQAHTGGYSLKVTPNVTSAVIPVMAYSDSSTFLTIPIRNVTIFSMYIYSPIATTGMVRIYSGSTAFTVLLSQGDTITIPANTWTRLYAVVATNPYTIPAQDYSILGAQFTWSGVNGQSVYFDSAMTYTDVDRSTLELGSNTNPNPDFETNTTGYTGAGVTLTRTNEWAATGSYSMKVVSTSNTPGTCYFWIGGDDTAFRLGMQAGRTYRLKATVNVTSPLPETPERDYRLGFNLYCKAGSTQYVWFLGKIPTSVGVHEMDMMFTLPDVGLTGASFLVGSNYVSGTTYYIDNITLQRVTGATLPDYFDGATVPEIPGREFTSKWNGTTGLSSSTLTEVFTHVHTVPATGGTLSSLTVFESIGEAAEERVEVTPAGLTAYGEEGRTELTSRGLEVYSASNQALLRLGHKIPTGMEIYDETSQLMVPLANFVFGNKIVQGGGIALTASSGTGWTDWQLRPISDFQVSSPTGRLAILLNLLAAPATAGPTWIVVGQVEVRLNGVAVATSDVVYGRAPMSDVSDPQPSFAFTSVNVPANETLTLTWLFRTRNTSTPVSGTPSVTSYTITCWPI